MLLIRHRLLLGAQGACPRRTVVVLFAVIVDVKEVIAIDFDDDDGNTVCVCFGILREEGTKNRISGNQLDKSKA